MRPNRELLEAFQSWSESARRYTHVRITWAKLRRAGAPGNILAHQRSVCRKWLRRAELAEAAFTELFDQHALAEDAERLLRSLDDVE